MALLHAGQALLPHDLWSAWTFDIIVVASLIVSAVLYERGVRRVWHSAGRGRGVTVGQRTRFWAGWITLFTALVSPLHALGSVLFSAHMTQHELLMVLAAPLLVTSQPLVAFAWAFDKTVLRRVSRWNATHWAGKLWRALSAPVAALVVHVVVLLAWHVPVLYQATLRNDGVHALQHASFFLSAAAFWWGLLNARRHAAGLGVAYLFVAMMITGVFGALLTFASQLWYPAYATTSAAWGLSPLDDQRLGGMIMWIPGGASYLIAALWLFSAWIGEHPTVRRPDVALRQRTNEP
jgi:putative membrane protein